MAVFLKVGNFPMNDCLKDGLKERGELYEDSKLDEAQRQAIREKTDYVIASGGTQFGAQDFESTPNLKGIACFSVGYDGIDIDEAIKRKIFVSNTPDVLTDDVANTAIMLMLNCTRQAKAAHEYIEQDEWGHCAPFPLTNSINHKTLGIAGLGRIGKEIALRAQAFKMKIAYFSRQKQDNNYQYYDNIKDLAANCDILVLAMSANAQNRHCVNLDVLKALGKNGYIINIARGSLIKTDDLIYALQSGVIAGAGLDVFENEPHVPSSLYHLPNVSLLPHLGSATMETRDVMAKLVLANLDAMMQGKEIKTPIPGTRTL